ncbi:MAG TPA: cytochrome c maturation protein CcmE [Stellaceae bacterium]|jgi:cytochrome c-type biogenesis protein CcmE|nr:cytochrome c maturation protein CcmE [Stellaceae bacterium]
MTRKRRRLYFVLGGVALLGLAVGLTLSALNDNLVFFYGPSDLYAEHIPPGRLVRIGGLVATGSVKHEADGSTLDFTVTDGKKSVPVTYRGTVPDLFREGQGVVVEGRLLTDGSFKATTLLAKHDERYMPPEVVEALKKAGRWQEGENGKPIPPAAPASAGATQ